MDRRLLLPNRLDESEIRGILIQYLTTDLKRIAGYIPPKLDVTGVTLPYSLPKPLYLVRNQPVFHMSVGWWDACVDWLRELEMPCEPRVAIKRRKQKDDTWKEVLIYTNSIAEHVEKLRKYVHLIDDKFERGVP